MDPADAYNVNFERDLLNSLENLDEYYKYVNWMGICLIFYLIPFILQLLFITLNKR